MNTRRSLNRIHIWLGWLIGVPLLLWTVSGFWMVVRPIEEVRGEQLRAAPLMLDMDRKIEGPAFFGKFPELESMKLVQQPSGPVWIYVFQDKSVRRASALDGRWQGKLSRDEARNIARQAFLGKAPLQTIKRFTAKAPPSDLRKARPSWQAHFADGTNLYIDAESGEVLALRTQQWRMFDFMWGLHIMDLQSREDTNHPILILFAALAALGVLLGLILLPMTGRRHKRRETDLTQHGA